MLFRVGLYCLVLLLSVVSASSVRSLRLRQAILLVGSYAVYASWGWRFVAVLLLSTVANFYLGQWLRRTLSSAVLWVGILFNLALLGIFKYVPEIAAGHPSLLPASFAHILLPLGLSFWTFQAMSYLFDLYREEELDPTLLEFALYMAFFPVIISGPVCRMPEMLDQFRAPAGNRWENIRRGLGRIATGVLMMQVAKLLGQGILSGDGIASGFDRTAQWSGPDVWCLAFGYGLQLFFDFAGYSHLAIGAAAMMGIEIPENFSRPFASVNPSIFWTRWHMSLSFWIRDYVFLPLAMLRRAQWWRFFVLLLSMTLFGLWHKATLLFLIWGSYHGVLLVGHRLVQKAQQHLPWKSEGPLWRAVSWVVTIVLISLAWIFFRASSWPVAKAMLAAIFSLGGYSTHYLSTSLYFIVLGVFVLYNGVLWGADVLGEISGTGEHTPRPAIVELLARSRWYWIPPLYILALLIVVAVTSAQSAPVSGLMYRAF